MMTRSRTQVNADWLFRGWFVQQALGSPKAESSFTDGIKPGGSQVNRAGKVATARPLDFHVVC
jgi:hypothetical protein